MVQKSKTKECPSCAMDIDPKAEFCPICEYHFPKTNPLYQWVAILLAILMLLLLFF
jgi:predicted amidophosphoribosyltransferase